MVARVGAEVGTSTAWPRKVTIPSPMERPMIAVIMGIPIAMAVPNVYNRMITAATSPTTTESSVDGLETFCPR